MNALRVALTISVWLHGCIVAANAAPDLEAIRARLRSVPAPELPITAAKIIQQSSAADREATTLSVVRAAVDLNPAAAPLLVGAVARALPEMVALAAATAAAKQPAQAEAITTTAVTIAPGNLGQIVKSMSAAVPNEFRDIALAAEQAAPNSRQEIIQSIGSSLPQLKPYLDREVMLYGRTGAPISLVLDHATIAQANATRTNSISDSSVQAAAQNPSNPSAPETPASRDPKAGGNGHHGGRNYAKP
jgi:hypothetical protein